MGLTITLHWRHNEHDGVSNHQHHNCLLNRLFKSRSKKTSKLHVTGLCEGNSPETGEFPTQRPVTRKMFPFDDVIMSWTKDGLVCWHIIYVTRPGWVNTLRPTQNCHRFADDIFKCIFFNENIWFLLENSFKVVPMDRINNIPELVQIIAWRRPGDKPLSEPVLVSLLAHMRHSASMSLNCSISPKYSH